MHSSSSFPVATQHRLDNPLGKRTTYSTEFVRSMFDDIARRYDFLNHLLSSGLDIVWRRKLVNLLRPYRHRRVLDLATGTADVALELVRSLDPQSVVGIDIAENMLAIGRAKIAKAGKSNVISLEQANAERLRFANGDFDCATVAFGVRNFENLEAGLSEICRVLTKDGVLVALEFSRPTIFPVKQFYTFYSRFILPLIGSLVSRNDSAYAYLPATIAEFPDGEAFCAVLQRCGFRSAKQQRLSFGIATLYLAEK